jgi:single-stranded-DNA-specific exonuclease
VEPVSERRWQRRSAADDSTRELESVFADALGVPSLLARLLLSRGLTQDQVEPFLAARLADLPNPFQIPDMESACERLLRARADGEQIAIHGDYDVDGITATTLLFVGLGELGFKSLSYNIPLRLRDGYGLSAEALQRAAQAGVSVVVTVDCGVSASEEAALARAEGLDLIITDHHQLPEQLPRACAVVNPQRCEEENPLRQLAGVGVAFMLLVALRRRLREDGGFNRASEPDLRRLLDLVALGTIADLVPLDGVNRPLVRYGLALLNAAERTGLRALRQVAAVHEINTGTVGYQLAPRLNAAGRLEDAALGVELLLEEDMVSALVRARALDACNRERRELEEQIFQQADAMVGRLGAEHSHAIVLASAGWHPGVIGIVASRLVERYHRPCVLVAFDADAGKGSARSISGFHLYRGLQACAEQLHAFGGHEMAAGLSVSRAAFDDFAAAFEAYARDHISAELLIPRLRFDSSLLLEELDLAVLRRLEEMAPCGMGNPEPVFLIESVRAMRVQAVGTHHLKLTVCQGGFSQPAIAFGMAERRADFDGELDLLASPQINRYRGRQTVQLRIRDVRRSVN